MKPEISLIKHLLTILRRIGPAGLEETALMTEMEVATGRPLTTQAARDALIYCTDRAWISNRRDDFDRTIYWLRMEGHTILSGL